MSRSPRLVHASRGLAAGYSKVALPHGCICFSIGKSPLWLQAPRFQARLIWLPGAMARCSWLQDNEELSYQVSRNRPPHCPMIHKACSVGRTGTNPHGAISACSQLKMIKTAQATSWPQLMCFESFRAIRNLEWRHFIR